LAGPTQMGSAPARTAPGETPPGRASAVRPAAGETCVVPLVGQVTTGTPVTWSSLCESAGGATGLTAVALPNGSRAGAGGRLGPAAAGIGGGTNTCTKPATNTSTVTADHRRRVRTARIMTSAHQTLPITRAANYQGLLSRYPSRTGVVASWPSQEPSVVSNTAPVVSFLQR
jgi:hypothetical protein